MITYRKECAIPYGRENLVSSGSCCGDPVRRTYKKIYQKTATHERQPELVVSSESSMADYIDSFAEECDINNILLRYSCGDVSVLNARQGIYADVSAFPADRSKSVVKANHTVSDALDSVSDSAVSDATVSDATVETVVKEGSSNG